ncbi:MAG: T9SS type A sorting domain-containing protein [Bacteroidota bacterium]
MPIDNYVTLKVFNMLGQEVATLVHEEKTAGSYKVDWNVPQSRIASGVSSKGGYASGVYFYRLEAEDFSETKKMILAR